MSERLFGASVRRREDARLVTGRGRYVADVALPGMLHVAVYRSPHAHARIVRIDAGEARRRPGVVHVLVPADVATLGRLPLLPHPSLIAPACPEILPQEIVSYAGQPVALVVAESAAQAADALEALRVEYEPLPAVASLDDALRPDGPRVHPGGNVASRFTQHVGDPAGALARAEVVLRERFRLHRGAGMAMETRAITARWDADLGQITVWSTTQAPQILRRMLARYLGLPEHAVRVVTQDIGGGFGPKAIVYSEDILVPAARPHARPPRALRRDAPRASARRHPGARPVARRRAGPHARRPDRRAPRRVRRTTAAPSSRGASSCPSSPRSACPAPTACRTTR